MRHLTSCHLGLHISWLCYSCSGIALPQAYFNCELSLTGWLRRIGEPTSQFSWLSFLSLYGYNINEIRGHYLMNYVRLISGGSVCKDGLLPPKFAPLFREKCEQSNQSCDHGEWRTIPLYTKAPLPFAPLGSFLLYSLCLRCFWHLLSLARPASRLSRMPEISTITPSQLFTKTSVRLL